MATQKKRPRRSSSSSAGANARRPGGQGAPGGAQRGEAGQGARPSSGGGPRRLGGQVPAASRPAPRSGAQRRNARRRRTNSNVIGWVSVAVVLAVVAVLVVVKLTGSSGGGSSAGTGGDPSGRNPVAASPAIVNLVTTVPAAVYDSVGTASQPNPFTVTKGQSALTSGGKVRFVYYGGEFCPYCALMRWSLVAALSRFGTFHGLKETASAGTDGDIPTFSFHGSTYTSKYLVFSPYEASDRNQTAFEPVPTSVDNLYEKYDGSLTSATPAPPFNPGPSPGIPFLDIGNKYVSSGDPVELGYIYYDTATSTNGPLFGGGPGRLAIARAIHDPSSAVGKAISANLFIAQANYITAAICAADGGQPASVCSTPGVTAAAKVIAASKAVS
jgi:hypothetical protein